MCKCFENELPVETLLPLGPTIWVLRKLAILHEVWSMSVADPGFPVGGRRPRRRAPTPEAAMFRKICMSKRKNLDPWGGRAPAAPPGSATA